MNIHVYFYLHFLCLPSAFTRLCKSTDLHIYVFAGVACENILAQGRGHQASHRGTELGEECSGTSLKASNKRTKARMCPGLSATRVCAGVRRFPSGALTGDSH